MPQSPNPSPQRGLGVAVVQGDNEEDPMEVRPPSPTPSPSTLPQRAAGADSVCASLWPRWAKHSAGEETNTYVRMPQPRRYPEAQVEEQPPLQKPASNQIVILSTQESWRKEQLRRRPLPEAAGESIQSILKLCDTHLQRLEEGLMPNGAW